MITSYGDPKPEVAFPVGCRVKWADKNKVYKPGTDGRPHGTVTHSYVHYKTHYSDDGEPEDAYWEQLVEVLWDGEPAPVRVTMTWELEKEPILFS